ncbi:MAG: DUF6544 family protein [Solirubrobacterales bacterium]
MASKLPDMLEVASLDHLDEPVRRYFRHALRLPMKAGVSTRLTMAGRIRVRSWLRFTATWEGDAMSFVWRARAGRLGLRPFTVVDRYEAGAGSMDVRLLGRLPLVTAEDEDTSRSAAGRTAVEAACWAPASLLPGGGVSWDAEGEHHIVARWRIPPEEPQVRIEIDERGAVRSVSVMRWDGGQQGRRGYVPFGGRVLAERRFGDLLLPSRLSVGWRFGGPCWEPFFEADVLTAESF